MTCRAPAEGKFCAPSELNPEVKELVLVMYGVSKVPQIYDLFTVTGSGSVCVYQNQILTLCQTGTLCKDKLTIHKAQDKYLYFALMYLHSQKDTRAISLLLPFLNDYDIDKLIQNRQYALLEAYLHLPSVEDDELPAPSADFSVKRLCAPNCKLGHGKQRIPPATMQEPALLPLFVRAGWLLPLDILLQYYDHVFYKLYRNSVLCVLEGSFFVRNEQYAEAYNRFVELALVRNDEQIYNLLLEKHK